MHIKATTLAATAFFVVVATPIRAQNPIQIGDRPTCTSCSVSLQPIVKLGSIEDPGGFGPLVQIAVNSRQEYVVSSSTFVGELFLYRPDGKFQRAIGRRGQGPGEFSRAQILAFDARDSLHAVDISGARHSVFTPDLQFARAVQLQARLLAFEIEPTGNIFAVAPKTVAEPFHALQVFSASGAALQSFDPIDPKATGQAAVGRSIAVDGKARRWSISTAKYQLKQWDTQGHLTRVYEARRDWIPDSLPMRLDLNTQKPPGQVGGLEVDERGLIWVFAIVPDANRRPLAPGTPPDMTKVFDTVMEVIDPETDDLLARGRSDTVVIPFAPDRAYSMVEEASGDRRIQIWRLELRGR